MPAFCKKDENRSCIPCSSKNWFVWFLKNQFFQRFSQCKRFKETCRLLRENYSSIDEQIYAALHATAYEGNFRIMLKSQVGAFPLKITCVERRLKVTAIEKRWPEARPVATGKHSGAMLPQIFWASRNFVVSRKIFIKHTCIIKTKILPPKMYFAPQTLKPGYGVFGSCSRTITVCA